MDFDARLTLCRDALRNRPTQQIPLMSNFVSALAIDSGYGFKGCFYDWDIAFKASCEFHERYQFDYYGDLNYTKPLRLADALDANSYDIDFEKQYIVAKDRFLMEDGEYDEFIQNFPKFFWEKAIPRKCRAARDSDAETRIRKAFEECNALFDYMGRMEQTMREKYNVPAQLKGSYSPPLDDLFNTYRGIKRLSIDIRRNREKVKAAIDMLWETQVWPSIQMTLDDPTPNTTAVADLAVYFTSNAILSAKQYNDLYWCHIKPAIDACAEKGKILMILCEGELLRFKEYYQDVPDGTAAVWCEQDDVFSIRKELPQLALVGGEPCTLLGYHTKEECIAYVKKVIDEVGDHGLTLTQDKMVAFKNDYTRENILAVNEFVRSYKA